MFLTFFPSLLLGTHLGHIFGKFLENACKLLIFLQISVLLISKIVILHVAQILFFYPSLVIFPKLFRYLSSVSFYSGLALSFKVEVCLSCLTNIDEYTLVTVNWYKVYFKFKGAFNIVSAFYVGLAMLSVCFLSV